MIRIRKTKEVPATLASLGVAARAALCDVYEQDKDAGLSFQEKIYGAFDVKEALIRAQHGKCCFCERKIFGDGDVEHFRPKAGVSQSAGTRMLKPGYYWLAYEWDNLLLSCSPCNSRHKRNLFPLVDGSKPIRNHRDADKISREEPLFIDPAREDPSIYIRFDGPVPYAVDDNVRGKETIRALGLDRDALNRIRREYLNTLEQVRGALRVASQKSEDVDWQATATVLEGILIDSQRDEAEFAAMARAAAIVDFRGDY